MQKQIEGNQNERRLSSTLLNVFLKRIACRGIEKIGLAARINKGNKANWMFLFSSILNRFV